MRRDIHRPSVINPADYQFVAFECEKDSDVYIALANRKIIQDHIARTGGTYSKHQHGGSCHICGAAAIYTALFYHRPTNSYIRTGGECAGKLDCYEDIDAFKSAIAAGREAQAGKRKAQAFLEKAGAGDVWIAYTATYPSDEAYFKSSLYRSVSILTDIISKLVKYGSMSDKQLNFARKLTDDIKNAEVIAAKRAAETAAAAPVPVSEERIIVRGKVLSIKIADPRYDAMPTRILVQAADGWKVFGSRPGSLSDVKRGDEVEFSAAITPSKDDPKFGFFSRPTKAKLITAA